MSLEQEVEISALGFQRVIFDLDMKPEIKMEKQDLEPERQAHLAGHIEAISRGLCPPLQHIKQEDDESTEPQQREAQQCNFLDTFPSLPLGQGLSELPEGVLQHGPKAFPSILEGAGPMSDGAKAEKVPKMTGMKEEEAADFPEGKETSLDVTLRQLSKEVKQEEDGNACMTDDKGQRDHQEMMTERENVQDLKVPVSNPNKPTEEQPEEPENDLVALKRRDLYATILRQPIPKGKQPSDKLFHSLNKHCQAHTGKELFECSDCGKAFISRAGFIVHIRVHGREKPYECSECGKHFRRSSHLNNHSKIHTRVKPFQCSDCGKTFSRSSSLVSHQHMHTGEKPYHCASCSKQFCDKYSLVRHERLHTDDKPYK
ncbi:hypothetical protein E2320_014480, partial [Naja naja]